MYLSRVEIDLNNRQKVKSLTHLGAYHDWVEHCFPTEIDNGERNRHLWRLDSLHGRHYLLILSESKPDENGLSLYGKIETIKVKQYDDFLRILKENEIMQFRLTANPTYSVLSEGEKRGKVYPHVTIEQQLTWLLDHAKQWGFEIIKTNEGNYCFDVTDRDRPLLLRKKSRKIHISRVTFEGILKIINKDLFLKALLNGVGREKAFGMGLLTVIPREEL